MRRVNIDQTDVGNTEKSVSPAASTAPLLPYRPTSIPTPEPEETSEDPYSCPGLIVSTHLGFTPPPTIQSPSTTTMAEHIAEDNHDATPAKAAGARFWEMMQTDEMKDCLRTFYKDVFATEEEIGDFTKDHVIHPYYSQGMMAGYIRTGDDMVVKQDNVAINISAMQVNKQFREAGSNLIYARHDFRFHDPRNAIWWFKHIGQLNFSNIRTVSFVLKSGWPDVNEPDEVCTIDSSQEELWHVLLCWLKPRHQLHKMILALNFLEEVRSIAPHHGKLRYELEHWRQKVKTALHNFRGLKHASIFDNHQVMFTARERNEHMMMMIQHCASAFTSTPKPKRTWTLAQTLEQLKLERIEAEKKRVEAEMERVDAAMNRVAKYRKRQKDSSSDDTEMGGTKY